jgi:hypothetical protein
MLFFLAFHFSLSLTPNCRNWSPNYSVLVLIANHKAGNRTRNRTQNRTRVDGSLWFNYGFVYDSMYDFVSRVSRNRIYIVISKEYKQRFRLFDYAYIPNNRNTQNRTFPFKFPAPRGTPPSPSGTLRPPGRLASPSRGSAQRKWQRNTC